jgi:hypothetical protein
VDVLNPRGARPRVSGFVQGVGSSLHQIESTFLQGAITALSLLASGAANIDGGNLVADSYG